MLGELSTGEGASAAIKGPECTDKASVATEKYPCGAIIMISFQYHVCHVWTNLLSLNNVFKRSKG